MFIKKTLTVTGSVFEYKLIKNNKMGHQIGSDLNASFLLVYRCFS
jgi:hypothetical protein